MSYFTTNIKSEHHLGNNQRPEAYMGKLLAQEEQVIRAALDAEATPTETGLQVPHDFFQRLTERLNEGGPTLEDMVRAMAEIGKS